MQEPAHPLHIAVIGAGPVGLGLALHAATQLPQAHVTVFDARPLDRDVSGDPRTLALSLGSIQTLERLGVWSAVSAASCPIHEVHVSQQQPALLWPGSREPVVRMSAAQQGVAQLGAVVSYGQLVAPLQAQWMEQMHAQPQRLFNRFGTSVRGLKPVDGGVEVDADIAQRFDLAVVAEGGVFAQQPPLSWPEGVHRDYHQTAWVGQVVLDRAHTTPCLAFERFTPQGPVALLPLPPAAGDPRARAALVWCVPRRDDPVASLSPAQRLALLNSVLHQDAGRVVEMSALKSFALGLNAAARLVQRADGDPPCVVRIGNAAQTLHPVAGQGLNLGLRDVEVLVHALQTRADLAAALRATECRRAPDRWALIGTTDFLARSFTWPIPALATLRGLGLGALQALPPLKSQLARSFMFGWRF